MTQKKLKWQHQPDLKLELQRVLREESPGLHDLRDQNGLLVGYVRIEAPVRKTSPLRRSLLASENVPTDPSDQM